MIIIKFGPPNGPTVGRENNFLEDIKRGGGGKNSHALVASYPALTFFLKKVCCMGSLKLVELGKHIPVFDEAYEIHNMY